jgi:hypothetical protein
VDVAHRAGDLAGGDLENLRGERGVEIALCWMRGGSQPISSSRPTTTRRSALASFRMKLGLASTKCGSW